MTDASLDLIVFSRHPVDPEPLLPAAEKILAGNPRQQVRNHYSDASGRFHAGTWECEAGKWQVAYSEHEFCHLLEGEVILTDAAGRATRLAAGAAFVIPAGFRGTWETVRPCRKYYVIYEPA